MIIKFFEKEKLSKIRGVFTLIYGENEGLKSEILENFFLKNFKGIVKKYSEKEVLENYDLLISSYANKSFFNEEQKVIISRVSDKLLNFINTILEKKITDIQFILTSDILEKKSKLRKLFEVEKNLNCIPVYLEDVRSMKFRAEKFFKNNKIPISQEIINLLIERCRGDSLNLNKEFQKINLYFLKKKKISIEEILVLTNLAEDFKISELADSCLSKNNKRTLKILNESNYSNEDNMIIIRSLLSKAKRIMNLKKQLKETKNIDEIISTHKPPIFWKDKEVVKKQLYSWDLGEIMNLIFRINDIELKIKTNSTNSLTILKDFIIDTSTTVNN